MKPKTRNLMIILGVFLFIVLISFLVPGIRERIMWRVDRLWLRVLYAINPPEETIFIPNTTNQENTPETDITGLPTPTQFFLTSTPTPAEANETTPTAQPTEIPASFANSGFKYFNQHGVWNYCAPSNLAMALSFWGWPGDRLDVGHYVKPVDNDMNVMPYELADYVNTQTQFKAIVRVAGTIDLLKQLIAAGFPVVVEKGTIIQSTYTGQDEWMGHYSYVTGYDDAMQQFITQDSYYTPDYIVPYSLMEEEWQSFNYVFLVVYPQDKETQVLNLLGELRDETRSYQIALERASNEIYNKTGIQVFFAWYNRGSSLVNMQDYSGAAEAYDSAFQALADMPEADVPKKILHVVWYETGPYFAYYYTGRYQDVIDLATQAMSLATSVPYLEESFYWRALARFALGQNADATADLCKSLEYHPNFNPSLAAMNSFGVYSCP